MIRICQHENPRYDAWVLLDENEINIFILDKKTNQKHVATVLNDSSLRSIILYVKNKIKEIENL